MIFESSSTSEVNNELRIANCKLRIANTFWQHAIYNS